MTALLEYSDLVFNAGFDGTFPLDFSERLTFIVRDISMLALTAALWWMSFIKWDSTTED